MAFLGGLLGGGGSDPMDIYGDLFTEKQRAALRDQQMTQGLLNAAAVFSKAGQASRLPVSIPWGEAAQALGGSGDEAMNRMLKGMQVAEEVRSSRQKRGFADQVAKFAQGLLDQEKQLGLPQGTLVKPYLAATQTAPALPGAPTDNASPPVPEIGPAPGAFGVPSQDVTRWGLPPRPTAMGPLSPPGVGPITPADYERLVPSQRQGGLLEPPPGQEIGQPPGPGVLPQLASLYGGGTGSQSPFDLASLGAAGGGLPDLSNIKIEQLSGEAAPAGGRPAPGDRSDAAWEYYKPIIKKLESGNRNIEQQVVPRGGGYNPSTGTVTGWSSASSPLQMLDSTFQGTARKAAIDVSQYPRAMNAPEAIQDEVGKALFKERGLQPWAAYNAPLARATGYDGPMANAGSGFSGRIEQLGSDAAPAGKIPGLNISPQGLAALNMLSKLGGLGSPFESLLETYYKSPGYLEEKARTEESARKKVGLEYDPLIAAQTEIAKSKVELEYKPKIEEAVQKLQSPILKEREQAKADIDRISKELEQNRNAALTPTDATIAGPDGQPVDTKISAMDLLLKQKDRADRIAKGDPAIRPGDVIGKPALSPQETARQQEAGKAPYATGDVTLTWPDGETRKVTLTGEQRKDVLEGRPVPAVGWPGTAGSASPDGTSATAGGGRIGEVVYPPGYAEATTVMLKERRPKAEAAVQSLNFNETASRLLDAGIISGFGASFRLDAAKAKALFGWNNEQIANTESFLATQARQVASSLASGAFGSGSSITDNDRAYAARMAGADSNLDEASLRFLLRQNNTAARWEIDKYNADVKRHDPKGRLPILRVEEPTKAEAKPSANQPTVLGRGQLGGKPYIKWSDGQWRPEGELPGQEKR